MGELLGWVRDVRRQSREIVALALERLAGLESQFRTLHPRITVSERASGRRGFEVGRPYSCKSRSSQKKCESVAKVSPVDALAVIVTGQSRAARRLFPPPQSVRVD